MAKKALTINLRIAGIRETLRALNRLPKEANDAIRDRAQPLAELLAAKVKSAGVAEGRQARAVASTVKARRDRVPVIEVGGTARIGRNRAPAFGLLFGSEFGADGRYGWYSLPRYSSSPGRQYKPNIGQASYWIFETVDAESDEISAAWNKAAADVVRSFGGV